MDTQGERFFIVSSGADGRNTAAILRAVYDAQGKKYQAGYLVEKGFGEVGSKIGQHTVVATTDALGVIPPNRKLIVPTADTRRRLEVCTLARQHGWPFAASLLHPDVQVLGIVRTGVNVVIHPGAILYDGVEIGDHVTIGPRAVLGADATVSDYACIGAGAILERRAYVGKGGVVETGTIVSQERRIGAWAKAGAGCVVEQDVAPGALWPAS